VFLEKFKELVNVCFIDFEMLDETTNIAPFMKRSIQYSNKCKSLITFKKIKEYFEEQNCTERCYERVFTFDEFKELAFLA
jgi:carboxypeptidase C (cathepsin A)